MGFNLRKRFRLGPLQLNFTERGYSSHTWRLWRWSWNSRTRQWTFDTPGPGSWKSERKG